MGRLAESFTHQFETIAPALFAWAALRLPPGVRAQFEPEDLLQEVACRAYEQFERFDSAVASFRSWVFGIARNVLREALRFLARHPRKSSERLETGWTHLLADPATSLSRRIARDETLRRVIARLGELSVDERRLLVYRGFEGLDHAEVGRILGVTVDAAEKRWQRLRDRLNLLGIPDAMIAA